ncbi:hypothetical protein [Bradyrhizobium neotropicale]|uniref:hypothetical protein n=1 Tax=Bradyrhizobium neotropicale TaxID=1497615 RepID=UPI001AD76AEB|nr:hypothetical protein [Bradyrhizobium neotropicale]MBO4228082.1 hypothetical protein [Bradyrhizobium neotropicale]
MFKSVRQKSNQATSENDPQILRRLSPIGKLRLYPAVITGKRNGNEIEATRAETSAARIDHFVAKFADNIKELADHMPAG